jgi:hypothetical protein
VLNHRLNHPFITQVTMGILGGILSMMIFLIAGPDIHEYSLMYQICLFSGMLLASLNILKRAESSQAGKPLLNGQGTAPLANGSHS